MNDEFLRDRTGKIIGRFDGQWLRDRTGRLVARYDKSDDRTRDGSGRIVGSGRPKDANIESWQQKRLATEFSRPL